MTAPLPGARTALAAVATLLALTGCTGGDPEVGDRTPAASSPGASAPAEDAASSPRGSPSTVPRNVGMPPRDACYDLAFDEVTEPTNDHPPVACGRRHTAQTIHVGHLDTVVDGHLLAVDSDLAREKVAASCEQRFVRYVGGTAEDRRLSRLEVVWFSPTLTQSDEGATWFRCDAVLLAAGEELAPLPSPRRLRGLLDRPGALEDVGLCGTRAPGAPRFARVVCSRPHAWRALSSIPIDAGRAYPGAASVRRAGESRCRDLARAELGDLDRFRYGWEWPTREQWEDGRRHGFCWVPQE